MCFFIRRAAMASTARRGRRGGPASTPSTRGQTARRGAFCLFRTTVRHRYAIAATSTPSPRPKKSKDAGPNLRQEQHDVRREAPVVFIVHYQSPGHPAGLQRRAPVAVGVVPERARRVRLGQVVQVSFARAGRY